MRLNRAQFLGAGAMALAATACGGSGSASDSTGTSVITGGGIEPTLHVASWPDSVDPANVAQFSAANGVRVTQSSFTSNEELLDRLDAAAGTAAYDIVVPDADHVAIEKGLGLLLELNHDLIPNLKHLDPHWTKLVYDPGNHYSVIKDTGITTFTRRSDRIPQGLSSWDEFFDFLPQAADLRVNFIESPSEVIGLALISLGHSMNTDDESQLDEARRLLLKVRPYVDTIDADYVDDFAAGKIDLGITYSGDALRVQDLRAKQADIAIAIPAKSEIWIDSWAIAAGSRSPNAAHAWINDFLAPAANAREMERNAYEVGTPDSFPLVRPHSLVINPLVVFSDDILSSYELLRTSPQGLQQRVTIWNEFMAA